MSSVEDTTSQNTTKAENWLGFIWKEFPNKESRGVFVDLVNEKHSGMKLSALDDLVDAIAALKGGGSGEKAKRSRGPQLSDKEKAEQLNQVLRAMDKNSTDKEIAKEVFGDLDAYIKVGPIKSEAKKNGLLTLEGRKLVLTKKGRAVVAKQ